MKDYRLSEIVAHCKRMAMGDNEPQDCDKCAEENLELYEFCLTNFEFCPYRLNIEPRDMIELPYKEFHEVYAGNGLWFVFYRAEGGLMESRYFNEEPEADAFLANLKGEKHDGI